MWIGILLINATNMKLAFLLCVSNILLYDIKLIAIEYVELDTANPMKKYTWRTKILINLTAKCVEIKGDIFLF